MAANEQMGKTESSAELGNFPVHWIVLTHVILLVMSSFVCIRLPGTQAMYVVCPGVIIGQAMLLLIWANLGNQPMVPKQMGTTAYVMLAFLMHYLFSSGLDAVSAVVLGSPFVLSGCVVLGLPLTLARWGGLRLERFGTEDLPPGHSFQFKLSQVLLLTAFAAVLFAPGYLAEIDPHGSGDTELAQHIALCLSLIVGGVVFFIAPLASIWLVLTSRPGLPRFGAVFVGWGLAGLLIASYWHKGLVEFALLSLMMVLAIVLMQGTLSVLRAYNYRAIRQS